MSERKPRYLSKTASFPVKSYRDGGKVRWKVVNLNRDTLMASEWVNDDKFGNEWLDRVMKEVKQEQIAAGVGW